MQFSSLALPVQHPVFTSSSKQSRTSKRIALGRGLEISGSKSRIQLPGPPPTQRTRFSTNLSLNHATTLMECIAAFFRPTMTGSPSWDLPTTATANTTSYGTPRRIRSRLSKTTRNSAAGQPHRCGERPTTTRRSTATSQWSRSTPHMTESSIIKDSVFSERYIH